MTNSSYLVRREIYQNQNVPKKKGSDESPAPVPDPDNATDQPGMGRKCLHDDVTDQLQSKNKNE